MTAKILRDRAFSPLSEIAAAVILPPVLAAVGTGSMFTCHTALGSMNSGTVDIIGHRSQSSCW